jgi:uncharacterized protein
MIGTDIRVVYTKYDGSLHWHQTMTRLGEDEHGVWLGGPPGRQAQRGDEPPVTFRQASVLLVRPNAWWTASFNAWPCWTEIYCDVTSPVSWSEPDQVTMIDLDLDVIRRFRRLSAPRRRTELLDEDEFAEHQRRYGYSEDVIAAARASSQWLARALVDGTEPFATAYRPWLAQVRPSRLPWKRVPTQRTG